MREFIKDWGYSSVHDLFETTLHYREFKPMFAMSLTLLGITSMIEQFVGLEPLMFLAWVALLLVELITGIKASLHEGRKIQSKRFGRFIFKVFIYISMISITHLLHIGSEGRIISSFYGFIYWLIVDYISIQLIISVFENLSRLGFQESSFVFKTIKDYLNKWFDLKEKNNDK
jgi:phage-related holin